MTDRKPVDVRPSAGKLLILTPGMGAVSTTLIAGTELIRRGHSRPYGSLTQMAHVRLGKRTERNFKPIRELVDLVPLDDLSFAAWDIIDEDAYSSARTCGVLQTEDLDKVEDFLRTVKPMPGAHDANVVRRLEASHQIPEGPRHQQADHLRRQIRDAMAEHGAARAVTVLITSTEVRQDPADIHQSAEAFEAALAADDRRITPTQLYAYASIMEGVPFANGTPNLAVDTPALQAVAKREGVPIAGKDLKTGQTMMKTALAPAFKARMLGIAGWFSTNILGNRDGEVLDDPDAFRSKEKTKSGVLDTILRPELYPELYESLYHKVRINYYPPRGDEKEGWDNIDIFGWLNYPMQIKIDFLCRDSILAAPICLDLALFLDLAHRAGWQGLQEWLSFYFKEPMVGPGLYPEHDLYAQLAKLKNTLRYIAGEDLITHLGLDYYQEDLDGPGGTNG